MNNRIILFGSGAIGYEALVYLGDENIECFCDNNLQLADTEKYGKRIISFDTLKQKYHDVIIMISANRRNSYAIAKQCEDNAIFDYLFYESLKGMFLDRIELLAFIADPMNRIQIRKNFYMEKVNELQIQVNYFKSHADIRHIKPAEGNLRKRQIELVQLSAEFFERISSLEIKPILYGGNLIGYVRHNGFIPWDDDIDFALIRTEYEELKNYCRLYLYEDKEFGEIEKCSNGKKNIIKGMEDYYWVDFGHHFQVVKHFSGGYNVGMDFFSLDYYAEEYPFDELMELAAKVKERCMIAVSREEIVECMRDMVKENSQNVVKESDHIYFGIDNTEIMHTYHRGSWIPREVVFPLQRILYEGAYFWVPNDPEEFAKYEYENIWEFPEDVGLQSHIIIDEK